MVVLADVQLASDVTTRELPSEKLADAWQSCAPVCGWHETETDVTVATPDSVNTTPPVTFWNLAAICTWPFEMCVTRPVASTVAMSVFDDDHAAPERVTSV